MCAVPSSMETHNIRVIVLKAPSENVDDPDPYVTLLNNANIPNVVVPTLQFKYKNIEILAKRLENYDDYSGVILSSPRCVQALIEAFKRTSDGNTGQMWKRMKCFTVGKATSRMVENRLNYQCEGDNTGNMANLLEYLSKYAFEKQLLMPTGNLSTDIESNLKIDKIEVYETVEHPNLADTLKSHLEANEKSSILAFFSPSGVRAAMSCISERMYKYLKFIALGPTTARELESRNLPVSRVCQKPTPESLLQSVLCIIEKG